MTMHARVRTQLGTLRLDCDLSVPSNVTVAVLGPNGAGKTTLLRIIAGLVPVDEGRVEIDGLVFEDTATRTRHTPEARRVGFVFQDHGLFPHLSVLENVMAGAQSRFGDGFFTSILGLPRGLRIERALREEAFAQLEHLGIAKFAGALPGGIPYGTAKKVSLARALMSHPTLLMLDEPASGLDENELEEFARIITELRVSMSVLLVEHNMDFVMPLVHQLIVLNFGQVIATGAPNDISTDPGVLAAYLGVD